MNNIGNPLSEYKSPPEEALRNFGIDISREAVEKYALEKFDRLPQSYIEMTSARDSKIIEETRRFMTMNNCNLTTCRYNADGKCTNEEKREECVEVSRKVLMIDDLADIEVPDNQFCEKKNPFDVCDTNPNCECDPTTCGFAVEYSTWEDVSNGIHRYMCGFDKCKYQK